LTIFGLIDSSCLFIKPLNYYSLKEFLNRFLQCASVLFNLLGMISVGHVKENRGRIKYILASQKVLESVWKDEDDAYWESVLRKSNSVKK